MTSEEKIRELCACLLAAQNEEAIARIAPLLRDALHDHCQKLRQMAASDYPVARLDMAAD